MSRRTISLSVGCFVIVTSGTSLFRRSEGKAGSLRGSPAWPSSSAREDRCWLKRALKSGDFQLFSHRSYHDSTRPGQPTCRESLSRLRSIGVNRLDLELVLDEGSGDGRLVVAHPLEFKRQSAHYSPCANTGFDEMAHALKLAYGEDFFVSLEPKAAWGGTREELGDAALANPPSDILRELLESIEEHELGGRCAAIVEIDEAREGRESEEERNLLREILRHCQLFRGIGLSDDPPTSMGEYDVLMPTIEFHPSHAHNIDGKTIPHGLRRKSILWVVDSEADLAMAADMHPLGIVSNSPSNIVRIVEDLSWCDE